ncbi:MAG: hypothetical protein M1825_005806 [Sarcosagium campestre]|nr:MAG: hypothetical protein M1825_005806 [Sarcosagium campestre]
MCQELYVSWKCGHRAYKGVAECDKVRRPDICPVPRQVEVKMGGGGAGRQQCSMCRLLTAQDWTPTGEDTQAVRGLEKLVEARVEEDGTVDRAEKTLATEPGSRVSTPSRVRTGAMRPRDVGRRKEESGAAIMGNHRGNIERDSVGGVDDEERGKRQDKESNCGGIKDGHGDKSEEGNKGNPDDEYDDDNDDGEWEKVVEKDEWEDKEIREGLQKVE